MGRKPAPSKAPPPEKVQTREARKASKRARDEQERRDELQHEAEADAARKAEKRRKRAEKQPVQVSDGELNHFLHSVDEGVVTGQDQAAHLIITVAHDRQNIGKKKKVSKKEKRRRAFELANEPARESQNSSLSNNDTVAVIQHAQLAIRPGSSTTVNDNNLSSSYQTARRRTWAARNCEDNSVAWTAGELPRVDPHPTHSVKNA